jgi:hypothetical protein
LTPPPPFPSTEYGYGRLLLLIGDRNTVVNCHFADGNGGAVEVRGDDNTITRNLFERCNNHPPNGGDYGAIQVMGPGQRNTISDNTIVGHAYSGISAYGTGAHDGVAHLTIRHNYIRSRSSDRTVNHSMGIYLLHGANEYVKITGNTIEAADAEGIVIESANAFPARKCLIVDNVIRDGAFAGISLQSTPGDDGAIFSDCTITGNVIENTSAAAAYAHQIGPRAADHVSTSLAPGDRREILTGQGARCMWGRNVTTVCHGVADR